MISPVSRSMDLLRAEGFVPWIVERFVARGTLHGLKFDLFGLADLEAIRYDVTLYVQVCRDEDLSDHIEKALACKYLGHLLANPHRRFQIWAWAKRGKSWSPKRYIAADAGHFVLLR